jgi:hypothetical protein
MVEMAVAEFNLVVDKLNRGLTLNTKHKESHSIIWLPP